MGKFTRLFTCLFVGSFCVAQSDAQSFTPADAIRCRSEALRVQIVKDIWGVPHIYGHTDADVVFGLLYAECAEDFPRVEKNYLEVLGRQAEAFGPAYLTNDLELQLIEDTAAAVRDYRHSPEWLVRLLDAFADGVNYYLFTHPHCQPALLRHFEPWFPLMFTDGSVSATSTGGIRSDEVRQFYMKDEPALATNALPDLETGSNGFAIAPSRSASGHALLYINPHVPFYFRMEAELVSEEGLNVYGAVTWGQFFVYQGFNAHCGWMHTTSFADVADLYLERVEERKKHWMYEYEGQWKNMSVRILHLKCLKEQRMIEVPVTAYYTGHGPVMGNREGKWLSLKEYNRSMNALMEAWLITKATSLSAYKQALNLRGNTTNNTVYADDQGNIAYWHGNFMPKRDSACDWSLPVDGTVSTTQWRGTYAPDDIVHVYNPGTGWIQNCNSTPFAVSGTSSPRAADYPAYMAPDGQNFRSINAIRLLEGAQHLTLDSLINIGYNHYLAAFDVLLPALLKAYDSASISLKVQLAEPIALLRQWNKYADESSVATTLAIEWGGRMATWAPHMVTTEQTTNALAMIQGEMDNSHAAEKISALADVISQLTRNFGTWQIPWGDINRYQRLTGHIQETYQDSLPSLPAGFGSASFGSLPSFQSRYIPGTIKRYGYSGNSFIAAIEFGPRIVAKTIVTGGESSDPASPHFSDQAQGYLHGQFKDVYFYRDDVLQHAEKTYHPGEE